MQPFRIGTVPYLNAIPLTHTLHKHPDIHITAAPPAQLSQMLNNNTIDVAMAPTADYCRAQGRWKILAPFGIIADGDVWTVKLFTNTPIDRCTPIALDSESHSSVALLKVILAEFFNRNHVAFNTATFTPRHADTDTNWLLIGDKALNGIPRRYTYDLARLWRDHTNLPFVFAVWAAQSDANLHTLANILTETAQTNLKHLDELADLYATSHGFEPHLARDYFKHIIRYNLTDTDRTAIQRFDALLEKHSLKGSTRD